MEADIILHYLHEQFPAMSFFYLKRDYRDKDVYEFFFSGTHEGSVIFDLMRLQNQEEPLNIIKNAVICSIKRMQLEESCEDESKIKKLWKKHKDK